VLKETKVSQYEKDFLYKGLLNTPSAADSPDGGFTADCFKKNVR
jgi:hypothetical protein